MKSYSYSLLRTLSLSAIGMLLLIPSFGQGTGLLFDDESYARVSITALLMRGDYGNLPVLTSLKKYTPEVGHQGDTGTCVGWATAYAARTIMEAQKQGWHDPALITAQAFSPSFVYNQIRSEQHDECRSGVRIEDALEVLKQNGVVRHSEFPFECDRSITTVDTVDASFNRIKDYKKLFDINSNNKVLPIKKSLSEGNPVVVGLEITDSFVSLHGAPLWMPGQEERIAGHALTVIGYDDNRYGGAFELMNSWGPSWGQNGFIWIRYSDFESYVKYAFELIGEEHIPGDDVDLEGTLAFLSADGRSMKADRQKHSYRMRQAYPSGTQFQLRISNDKPAYVYAFGSDLSKKSYRIFPMDIGISPYLGYRSNNVAIPDEDHLIQMDEQVGTDYLAVLYTKEELDLEDIMTQMEQQEGEFAERLHAILETYAVADSNVVFNTQGGIGFSAISRGATVVPVIVEIEHTP